MLIPDICLKWINLQRSGYKCTKEQFNDDMIKEYDFMSPYLPEKCESIIDIGCGVGGIDVLLSKHYGNPELILLDSAKETDIIYGFDKGESFYNTFEATIALMQANNIDNYHCHDVRLGRPTTPGVDMIISILSWGYHYPVSEYMKYVDINLNDDGVLIMDIRESTEGIREVGKYFSNINVISNYNKSHRICARR